MLHTLLYFLALLSLSTSSIWSKVNQMPASVLGFWRLAVAALLLNLWVFAYKKKKWPVMDRNFLWILTAGFFFFLHLWTYKYAAKHALIANMMILFATNPLWSTLGSILFFKEKMTVRLALAYFLAGLAIVILVHKQFQFGGPTLLGDLTALLSSFLFSAYMLTSKKARLHFPNTIFASIQYLTCALLFLLVVLFNHDPFTGYSDLSWISILGLVAFPTFLGHFSSTYLLSHMNLSLMACGKLIEPVIAAILAFIIFREVLTGEAVIAFLLTALSLMILFVPNYFKARAKNP